MKIRNLFFLFALIVVTIVATNFVAYGKGGRAGSTGVIFVTSQGLYYDVITPVEVLPQHGRFQKLDPTTSPASTEFGPGTPGYLGGRWWVDTNGNNEMDPTDTYFLCPLLGPGRETP